MLNSTVNRHNTVNWRNNLNDMSDLEDDSDNELPLSSILDVGHPIDNHKIVKNDVQKYETADCQPKLKIKQDSKLPHTSKDFVHPINNYKIIKCASQKYDETVDYQIEVDINQDYELPLSSIADFLHPFDYKLENNELQKCGIKDCQTEVNNNQDSKLTDSSNAQLLHPIDNNFLKLEADNWQSEENINHCIMSEPKGIIYNKEQSTIDNLSRKYECDICGKIFPKRTDIIKHFKISLCYPEIVYLFDNF